MSGEMPPTTPPVTYKLLAEFACTNPPKLLGYHIILNGKVIAVIPADEVERIQATSDNDAWSAP